jgi:RimJ/RimL family protein N-acetyltransferase
MHSLMIVKPVTLAGKVVRLEPLGKEHASDLYKASQDPDIWTYMPVDPSRSPEVFSAWIEAALAAQAEGQQLPFAIIDAEAGRAIGSTRYLNISGRDYGLEIGWTWLAPEVRRTAVNTECKFLLLRHAFESLGAIRVQFKTDRRNERSQRAILRLGALLEGVLRKHMILESGYQRDSVMFSIIADEWPAVRANLEEKMAKDLSA